MPIRLEQSLKPSPHELWLKAQDLYSQFPGPLMWAFKELPTQEAIHEERVRRMEYPDLYPILGEFEDLLMNVNITPYWTSRLLGDLLNQWHDGVFKPGISPIKRAGELTKEELNYWFSIRCLDLSEKEKDDFVQKNEEIREPIFSELGLTDSDGEGIFNPTKAFILEKNAFGRSQRLQQEAQEMLGELQFQQVTNWFRGLKGHPKEETREDSWFDQFVKVHGEAPLQPWTFPIPAR